MPHLSWSTLAELPRGIYSSSCHGEGGERLETELVCVWTCVWVHRAVCICWGPYLNPVLEAVCANNAPSKYNMWKCITNVSTPPRTPSILHPPSSVSRVRFKANLDIFNSGIFVMIILDVAGCGVSSHLLNTEVHLYSAWADGAGTSSLQMNERSKIQYHATLCHQAYANIHWRRAATSRYFWSILIFF